jgi:hypothetical protein
MSQAAKLHELPRISDSRVEDRQQRILQWFLPHQETQMVSQQAKGVFLPYPLIAILVSVGALVLGGIIALEVQVSNLNTTLLLRDNDFRQQVHDIQEKQAQLEVYIHDDRERLVRLQTQLETKNRR